MIESGLYGVVFVAIVFSVLVIVDRFLNTWREIEHEKIISYEVIQRERIRARFSQLSEELMRKEKKQERNKI